MQEPQNEMDFLLEETLKASEEIGLENSLNEKADFFEQSFLEDVPNGAGVIYRVEKSGGIDTLRCSESPNLRSDWSSIVKLPSESGELCFYETQNYSEASFLATHFRNYKLSLMDSTSDYSSFTTNNMWWGVSDQSNFKIRFGRVPNKSDGVVELGPLGDQSLAKHYFLELFRFSQKLTDSCEPVMKKDLISFEFKSIDQLKNFEELLWLKKSFHFNTLFDESPMTGIEKLDFLAMVTYFKELSLIRGFWSAVAEDLFQTQ